MILPYSRLAYQSLFLTLWINGDTGLMKIFSFQSVPVNTIFRRKTMYMAHTEKPASIIVYSRPLFRQGKLLSSTTIYDTKIKITKCKVFQETTIKICKRSILIINTNRNFTNLPKTNLEVTLILWGRVV